MTDAPHNIQTTIIKRNILYDNTKNKQTIQYDEYSCDICLCNGVDQSIRTAFKVNYCKECKTQLELITQSTAINDYLLSKEDVKGLNHMKVSNPRNEDWKPMILYRKSEVEEISKRKYPSIEEEKALRREKLKKRKEKSLKKKLSLLRQTTKLRLKQETTHSHEFSEEGMCTCGMKIEIEEI
ncbi:DNA-repair protein complementing XP-A cells [Nematocida parisii]|uniref:XPA C-terminal domain-containing protein n=1 Tax=Nematocida parisii (strain ERTm3) TaxID=935791 RepID=I3EII9_NEMP3|nr:uncharacterized protein NEPG_01751 [Nematocida parisii ERTm1]EIJ89036.1 hypothetical protein NEQG_00855 [Nematocida parisii ERTm3]KAI5125969.1 DNA-repair protein complementing XP-A cells [Nematocida parisii]EIJ93409.1 hypothetical protein NEPG_01751 [Nematocida parisii ERTm1]KAI5126234.1 DNA-repair protein complementing XP-A cells [Nematocida parisii]KAI5140479.1 DNA-repair protein complementing XP-A cells [Nematocida parisii]|eukprot:XP_013059579.1 hypothetical protein NEPG_01751 [Nematocida parisii ERTm1]